MVLIDFEQQQKWSILLIHKINDYLYVNCAVKENYWHYLFSYMPASFFYLIMACFVILLLSCASAIYRIVVTVVLYLMQNVNVHH